MKSMTIQQLLKLNTSPTAYEYTPAPRCDVLHLLTAATPTVLDRKLIVMGPQEVAFVGTHTLGHQIELHDIEVIASYSAKFHQAEGLSDETKKAQSKLGGWHDILVHGFKNAFFFDTDFFDATDLNNTDFADGERLWIKGGSLRNMSFWNSAVNNWWGGGHLINGVREIVFENVDFYSECRQPDAHNAVFVAMLNCRFHSSTMIPNLFNNVARVAMVGNSWVNRPWTVAPIVCIGSAPTLDCVVNNTLPGDTSYVAAKEIVTDGKYSYEQIKPVANLDGWPTWMRKRIELAATLT